MDQLFSCRVTSPTATRLSRRIIFGMSRNASSIASLFASADWTLEEIPIKSLEAVSRQPAQPISAQRRIQIGAKEALGANGRVFRGLRRFIGEHPWGTPKKRGSSYFKVLRRKS